ASSGKPDHFFEYDLRDLSFSINNYSNDARRIYMDIQNLLNIAVKSDELNKMAVDMKLDSVCLYNDAQFRFEDAARNLEWAVYSAKPEVIGHDAQWTASNIKSDVGDYSWKIRNIYYGLQDLVKKTQP
ncbi:MAG: hypothetical protein KAI33_02995, partial [Elusimicrobiales bacterium]|nr:hypothetical protein [Elusimicrobiales bacterium]